MECPERCFMEKFFCISNFELFPLNLTDYCANYVIYDNSETIDIKNKISSNYNNVKEKVNFGHSLSNFFEYMYDEYHNLPEIIFFLKSNIIGRHVTKDFFERTLDNKHFTFLYNDESYFDDILISSRLHDSSFIERNNNWFVNTHKAKYFITVNELLNFIFVNPVLPEFLNFAPGGCYIIPNHQIKRLPRDLFSFLKIIVSHQFLPNEAYLVERIMNIIFNANYQIQPYFYDVKNLHLEMKKYELSSDPNIESRLDFAKKHDFERIIRILKNFRKI